MRELEPKVVCLVLPRWADLEPELDSEDLQWRIHHEYVCPEELSTHDRLDNPRMWSERDSVQAKSNSVDARSEQALHHWSGSFYGDEISRGDDSTKRR